MNSDDDKVQPGAVSFPSEFVDETGDHEYNVGTMGPMIQKEMKYNLHYCDVRGDVLPPP